MDRISWHIDVAALADGDVESPQLRIPSGIICLSVHSGLSPAVGLKFKLHHVSPIQAPANVICAIDFENNSGPAKNVSASLCGICKPDLRPLEFTVEQSINSLRQGGFIKNGALNVTIFADLMHQPPDLIGPISSEPNPKDLIQAVLAPHDGAKVCPISSSDMNWLTYRAYNTFLSQPTLLRLGTPLVIVGDLHGKFSDLMQIFGKFGYPNTTNYLFLGDLVDRGDNAIDILITLFSFKVMYPENIFILRGNHECEEISTFYGFKAECSQKGVSYESFMPVFDALPIAAVVGQKIFCVHGGLSPTLRDLSQLEEWERPYSLPKIGLIHELLWSDPDPKVDYYGSSTRGYGYTFGKKAVEKFFKHTGCKLIVRAHETVPEGILESDGVITVFSASGQRDGNKSGVMIINSDLAYQFHSFPCIQGTETSDKNDRDGK